MKRIVLNAMSVATICFSLVSCGYKPVPPDDARQVNSNQRTARTESVTLALGQTITATDNETYNVNTTASRVWLNVSEFEAGCACYAPNDPNGCPKLIIKDGNGVEVLNTECQPTVKFVRVPGDRFTVQFIKPTWASFNISAKIKVENW
ncbi:hypothetical protein AD998_08260 [bacterium 336/3]|nr:hypothetical protein AD998_08260 [bacterium 336/3]